jgi:hypothetical protein
MSMQKIHKCNRLLGKLRLGFRAISGDPVFAGSYRAAVHPRLSRCIR